MSSNRNPQIDLIRLASGFSRLPRAAQAVVGLIVVAVLAMAGVIYLRGGGGLAGLGSTPDAAPAAQPTTLPQPTVGPSAPASVDTPHLLPGNPSGAAADAGRPDNYLIVRPAYALAYNNDLGTARWVSWRIIRADFGQSPREVEFLADPLLPRAFRQIGHRDYSGSGFDRGHLCPKGDRGGDRDQAASTFYTTNIIPQAANVNQKAWNNLENYTRDLVGQKRQRVWVISGPAGRGGTGLNGYKETVGSGKIVVPAECWKVIVAIPDTGRPSDGPAAIGATARVIAVIVPNDQSKVGDDWAKFRTTPAEIEKRTGLKFFDRLRGDVAETLRRKLDTETIPPVDPNRYNRD